MSEQRPHYSNLSLDLGERFMRTGGKLAAPLVKAWAGSSYPNYEQQSWRVEPQLSDVYLPPSQWQEALGDPDAYLKPPRLWRNTVPIAAVGSSLDRILEEAEEEAFEAVAFESQGEVRVAHSEDRPLFTPIGAEDVLKGVAFRMGGGPAKFSLGYWLPASRELKLPEKVVWLFPDLVPTKQLGKRWPGIKLV